MANLESLGPKRHDERIIIHFDYDCFYAAVFEREDPKLRYLPLAVQQKQIIVTCNYEARRRGLYKLQLVREARKMCPDVIIVLGEDLTRFRNASKDLYSFLRSYAWGKKVERLGFDEVFMDVSDIIDYNIELLNYHDLNSSYFHLDRNDPTVGFAYDALAISGHTFPLNTPRPISPPASTSPSPVTRGPDNLHVRLLLGSHVARHLRHQLEEQKGYTCTVGISTNKLISKLVGNLNKPKGQTTLLGPYLCGQGEIESTVTQFIDGHDIGKIPGIGFKAAQKIRSYLLGRPAAFDAGLIYGPTKEKVTVKDVRTHPGMGSELLERLIGGPGAPKGIGAVVWGLLNGVDDSEVAKARNVPQQISIEDSYIRLDLMEDVKKELIMLAGSLIRRMRLDLTSGSDTDIDVLLKDQQETVQDAGASTSRRWVARPQTLRLTTRPRPPLNPDGSRARIFTRISKSSNMPSFVFSFSSDVDLLAEKLVSEALLPLFRKLHPEKSNWNLSLVNLCSTNMSLVAADDKDGAGRDIGRMFRRQEDVLKEWKVDDLNVAPSDDEAEDVNAEEPDDDEGGNEMVLETNFTDKSYGFEDVHASIQESRSDDAWDNEGDSLHQGNACKICGAVMPPFAMIAHERFHTLPD